MKAVELASVTFDYPDGPRALDDVTISAGDGDVLLLLGGSGSGKSTLLRTVNGLVPYSSGGRFGGEVRIRGESVAGRPPRDMAGLVGFVHQDPEAQFVVDEVEADVAFVLENLGMSATEIRRRVEEILDALGVASLRRRSPATLSGGEKQRCAIAGAIAASPAVLVLDEPTSQLDPQGADDVIAAVARLNSDLGTTVLIAEHRLERAAPVATGAVVLECGRVTDQGVPESVVANYVGAPTVIQLGHLLGWSPPPLTVRDARVAAAADDRLTALVDLVESRGDRETPATAVEVAGEPLVIGRAISHKFGPVNALNGVDIEIREGDVVALLGRNGSGKTTLLRVLAGLLDPARGEVRRRGRVAYVPQNPGSLLFAETVRDEFRETRRLLRQTDDECVQAWIDRLGLESVAKRHPRSLSGGERQRVAIGAVAVGGAEVLLLDEPTRGIDAESRLALESAIADHADSGGAVVIATHDIELAARVARVALVLGDGAVVAQGPAREVLAGSLFAPQVMRVLPPFMTVDEVARAIAEKL